MQQEWNLYMHVNTSERVIPDVFKGDFLILFFFQTNLSLLILNKGYDRPAYTMCGSISRRPGYYLNNAYMLIFFITILGFVPFSFGAHTPVIKLFTLN